MSIDWKLFHANRAALPLAELARYAGQWVAWNSDGTRIIAASAESQDAVWDQVQDLDLELSDCCLSYVSATDDVLIGPVIWNRLSSEQKARFDSR